MHDGWLVILIVGVASAFFRALADCWKSRDHRSNVATICSSIEFLCISGGDTDQFAAALKAVQRDRGTELDKAGSVVESLRELMADRRAGMGSPRRTKSAALADK
jgi:hypothetical protein